MPPKNKTVTQDGDPVEDASSYTAKVSREVAQPTRKPDGAPDLIPWHATSRRQKAQFLTVIDTIGTMGSGVGAAASLAADIEDALIAVAFVPAQAKGWFSEADDNDLRDLYGWYSAQMGEATASPSS